MARKNADYACLNDASALGATKSTLTILGRDGSEQVLANKAKAAIAKRLVELERPAVDPG